jgi:hypothetical protein
MARHAVHLAGTALVLTAVLGGCSDGGAPTAGEVSLNLATRPAPIGASAAGAAFGVVSTPETYIDTDGNTLVISAVQLVLREIELERTDAPAGCDPAAVEDDDCDEDLEFGPLLVDLPLGAAGAERSFSVPMEPGEFDELELKVHRASAGDSEDAAFLAAHPEFDGVSVRVAGTYNGSAFTFDTDLDVELEFDLDPPLVVSQTSSSDVTVLVDLATWFRVESGLLIHPESANTGGDNESVVEENIKNSLEAFEDEDRDGSED